jgi:hypothetical protein
MNNHVLNLAEQAGASYNQKLASYELHPEQLAQFLELVVMECANIVSDAVDHREPATTYAAKIKQHFGLE